MGIICYGMGLICHSKRGSWVLSRRSEIKRGRQREVNLPVNKNFSLSLSIIVFFYHSRTFRLRFRDDTLLVPAAREGVAYSLFLGLFSYLSVISYFEPVQPLSPFYPESRITYLRIKAIVSIPPIQILRTYTIVRTLGGTIYRHRIRELAWGLR